MFRIIFRVVHAHKVIPVIHSLRVAERKCMTHHKIHAILRHAAQMDCVAYLMEPLYVRVKPEWLERHHNADLNVLSALNVRSNKHV